MKSITSLSAAAPVVVVALILLSSSGEVESFASPSRRVSKVITSKSKQVNHHHHNLSPGLPPSSTNRPSYLDTAPLFAILKDDDSEEATDDVTPTRTSPSRRSRILSTLRQKYKPITLAILTSTSTFFLPSFLLPPAKASAPIVLRANKKKDDPPMMQADKKAAELKKQKSLEEFDAFMAKANDIEISQGKAARDAYEKQYQIDKLEKEAQKELDIQLLKQQLLDEGKDYHTDLDAERQVYLLEHDIDLEKISGTPQNELMIKNFQSRNRKKKKGTEESSSYKQHQRYIIQCQVLDLKSRGINPLEHFEQSDVIDKTRAIYKMDDKVAAKVAKQYEQLMVQYDGRLTPPKEGEVPFEYTTGVVADMVNDKGGVKALGGSASDKKKEERAALKAKRAAEKDALRKQKQEVKAQRAEAKAAAKKERAAAKEQQLAEKAAAAAVASASASSSTALVSMDDGDVASTANGDISASAGNNAVSIPSSSKEEQVATTKSKSSSDVLSQIKQQTTPKNVATVVITGGAAAYGFNYYKENNAAAISEREKQLKLILGNDLDEEDDDDDEFDDDDEDDDDYEQFTKKRKTPEPAKPKPAEEPKASTKPPSPPPVPTPPSTTPPKPRRLGIFSKRNANARETDLNALVSPGTAQAPEFATLLAQILTFGAPGRFPAILAWGTPMPFSTFDLEEAKSLLTTSRQDADLTDEQSAEIFASVVNCMIIDIVDLASIALKSKDKDEKVAVDAINVVMDFMDHAASLFDAVAEDVTIKPVTYGGKLRKKDLEQMFSVYAGSSMMSLDALAGGGGTSQDRVDTLQLVFAIPDKKAEGLMQKHMMKMMMNLMKDGGKGLDGMLPEGMEGMEGMEEMMAAMGGGAMPGMLPGMDGGEMSPEDLKQTVSMMKDLMDSGQVSEEELVEVRKQFREMYGSDIGDLIKKADAEGAGEGMTNDERELLDMFKQILGE